MKQKRLVILRREVEIRNRKQLGKHKKKRIDKQRQNPTDKDNKTDRVECHSTSMTHQNREETQVKK